METLKLGVGFVLFIAGVLYFYAPKLISGINNILRDFCFNERTVLLYHKKIAVILISLSFIALYMGSTAIHYQLKPKPKSDPIDSNRLAAMDLYYKGDYRGSLRKTYWVLSNKPNDQWALVHLGCVYEMLDENQKAVEMWERVLAIYPENKIAKRSLVKLKGMEAKSGKRATRK